MQAGDAAGFAPFVRTANAGDGPVSYVDIGAGAPLLLVHGGHGGWFHWMANLRALSAQRRVIAPDMPGFGASASPRGELSLAGLSSVLIALLDTLGIEQIDVAAFSFGCLVGATLAVAAPDRVRSLALVSPAGMGPVSSHLIDIQARASAKARSEGLDRAAEMVLAEIMLSTTQRVTPGLTRLIAEHVSATRVVTRPIARTNPLRALLQRSSTPLWIALGTEDPHQAHELDERVAWFRSLRADTSVSVTAAAHWLQYEKWTWFNEHLIRFIEATSSCKESHE